MTQGKEFATDEETLRLLRQLIVERDGNVASIARYFGVKHHTVNDAINKRPELVELLKSARNELYEDGANDFARMAHKAYMSQKENMFISSRHIIEQLRRMDKRRERLEMNQTNTNLENEAYQEAHYRTDREVQEGSSVASQPPLLHQGSEWEQNPLCP